MGRWWAVHENGPSDKYRHYYWDRKAKCTQTQNKTYRTNKGRWWASHENGPHFKYRHYHCDRKTPNATPSYVKYRVEIVT